MAEHQRDGSTHTGAVLKGRRVAILVTDAFEQVEMTEPRRALQEAGAETMLIAPEKGQVQGFDGKEKADAFPVDMTLDEADPQEFDAVLLPGGTYNADKLRVHPAARKFIKKIDEQDKPVAVICHAPWLLVSSGLVKGRTLTSYHTLQDDIRNAGGRWLDLEVVRDHNWVSSRNPDDLPAFNREMVSLFAEYEPSGARTEKEPRKIA